MNIKCVRLAATTEDIICEYEDLGTMAKLTNPVVIAGAAEDSGKFNLRIIPFIPFSGDNFIVIDKAHILAVYNPVNEITNKYNSIFGSGIITPSQNIAIPQPQILTE